MTLILGGALTLLGLAMIWLGRPKAGEDCAPFLRAWPVGQLYVMTAMVCLVIGASVFISGLAA